MAKSKTKKYGRQSAHALIYDLIIISVGIIAALFLAKVGFIDKAIDFLQDFHIVASFLAGMFFTSAFTLAPASVALARIAEYAPVHTIALWGGLGALCGDLILFFFIKDRFYDDLMKALKPKIRHHIFRSFHLGFLKWLSPLVGAVIIASPLPDELGVALLGVSKVKLAVLAPISFVMNVLGIYILLGFVNIFF